MQSKSFATDLSNLKDLFEKSKTELFLESRAKAQLAVECQNLSDELKERVRSDKITASVLNASRLSVSISATIVASDNQILKTLCSINYFNRTATLKVLGRSYVYSFMMLLRNVAYSVRLGSGML